MNIEIVTCTPSDRFSSAKVETYELIDDQTVRRFRESLGEIVESGATDIQLDMSEVRMLSSMAICAVISIDNQLKKLGGRLRLREIQPVAFEVSRHMRLGEILDIEASDDMTLVA